jgi:hypothetical protein
MKHTVWFFLAIFTAASIAQQSDTAPLRDQFALFAAPASAIPEADGTQTGTAAPASKPAQTQKGKPKDTTTTENKWPTVESSMVGYIDNAIVGNEIRIRFDAAFNDQFPDRAEFIYGKCGCYRNPNLPPGIFDPNTPGPGPGQASGIPNSVNFQTLSFMGEYAPARRFSVFAEIPIRWLQPSGNVLGAPPAFSNGAGISDITLGLKYAMLVTEHHYLTAQFTTYFPSGNAVHGLGTNHFSLEPAILYHGTVSDRFAVEGEIGGWLPIGGSAGSPTTGSQGFAGNIFFYGIGPSYKLIDNNKFRLAPVVELIGWSVTGGQQTEITTNGGPTFDASGTNIVNIKLGARVAFRQRNSVYIGYGVALTSADWYNDIIRVEYRYSF